MQQLIRICALFFLFSTKFALASLNEHNQSSFPNIASAILFASEQHPDLLLSINWPEVNSSLADPSAVFTNWLENAEWAQPLLLTHQEIQIAQVWMLPDPENWMTIGTLHNAVFQLLLVRYLKLTRYPVNPALLLSVISHDNASILITQLLKENPFLTIFFLFHLQALQQGLLQLDTTSLLLMLNLRDELECIISDYLNGNLKPEIMVAFINWLLRCALPKEILYDMITFVHYCLSRIHQAQELLEGLTPEQLQTFFHYLADNHGSLVTHAENHNPTVAWQIFEAAFNHAQQQLTDSQLELLEQATINTPLPPLVNDEPEIETSYQDTLADLLDDAMQQVHDDFSKIIGKGGISEQHHSY